MTIILKLKQTVRRVFTGSRTVPPVEPCPYPCRVEFPAYGPDCCDRPMHEGNPEFWFLPDWSLFAERVFHCKECGRHVRVEITDPVMAYVLHGLEVNR